jgi:hypothetical protein
LTRPVGVVVSPLPARRSLFIMRITPTAEMLRDKCAELATEDHLYNQEEWDFPT